MWKKEGMTQLHKKLYKVTKRIQQGMTPLYSVAFNFIDDRFYDYFVSAGGNGINMCICLDDGDIFPLHSYTDEDEESFYTASWACDVERNPFVVAGGFNGRIRVINVNDKIVHKTLVGHEGPVNEIRTHPMKPQLVISASKDGSVRLWNIETGICILIFAGTGGHRSEVLSVDFHASDMSRFVSCDMEATTKIWSLTASDRSNLLNCNRWYGYNILSKGDACDIRLWQPQLKENSPGEGDFYVRLVYAIPDSYHRIIKFSCDLSMKFVSVGNDKGDIYVWDLKSFPPVLVTVLSHYKSKSLIRQTAMSTDGTYVHLLSHQYIIIL
ncbi:unnamed protein product [Brassica rapa]|uniref:Uncharacterized protein n=1 Tax=Brassica campestris TaxID=3711 RepID=A0A8D9GC10_BRACM|nr:unnamed protein product [Brassica rapa]